jgi:hypothetical protein
MLITFLMVKKRKGRGREEGKNGNIIKVINLVRVYCMHVQNYHNDIPSYYRCMLIKTKIIFKRLRTTVKPGKILSIQEAKAGRALQPRSLRTA